jgi:hypothetical protein
MTTRNYSRVAMPGAFSGTLIQRRSACEWR